MQMRNILLMILVLLMTIGWSLGCSSESDDDDDDKAPESDDDDNEDNLPVDENDREKSARALVITTEEMEAAWKVFADWKDRTGFRTDVVLIEELLSGKSSDAIALKAAISNAYEQGVRYVLLGGDADQIPYLRGYTEVWALESYYGSAPIQTFYEELDTDWDADGDGVYGEKDDDITSENLRNPKMSVGRVPVETHDEAIGYIEKLIRYESGEGQVADRATSPIFMADIAASVPVVGDIDGGIMHEQLIKDYIPENFQQNMRRLYGTELYADFVGAEVGTTQKIISAFENEGYAFSVTNTHGSFYSLTLLLDRYDIKALKNEVPFIFVTTSCLSGNFADRAIGNGDNDPQTGADSVSEELVKNPNGGAVATIANTLIGLGPVGGVQFNHAICRAIFKEGDTILGDAMLNARRTLWSEVAYVEFGDWDIQFGMDFFPGIEWYTQRSVLLLGDPTLRVWTEIPEAFEMDAPSGFAVGHNDIEVQVTLGGEPAANVTTVLSQVDGVLVLKKTDQEGKAQFSVKLDAKDKVLITAYEENKVPATVELYAQ